MDFASHHITNILNLKTCIVYVPIINKNIYPTRTQDVCLQDYTSSPIIFGFMSCAKNFENVHGR